MNTSNPKPIAVGAVDAIVASAMNTTDPENDMERLALEEHDARKPTPGPWVMRKGNGFTEIYGPNEVDAGIVIYNTHAQTGDSAPTDAWFAERMANARLIAAAPDLLAALISTRAWCMGVLTGVRASEFPDHLPLDPESVIDSAIAKATGKPV